jgi:hypothetical protein
MEKYYSCSCGHEIIQLSDNIDIFDREKKAYNAEIYFSMFHYGSQDHRYSLKEILRHCWKILRTGKPYPDDVILSIEEAMRLGNDLMIMADEKRIQEEVDRQCK